ncbi:MAG: hypothetical protein ACFB0F_01230 [Neomegalonema sp.]
MKRDRKETSEPPRRDDLPGVWRRELIETPDGSRDESSLVLWVQGLSMYCDIRLPAPGSGAVVDAFAGSIELSNEPGALRCHRRRELDWSTTPGPKDIGRLTCAGEGDARRMREDGVETDYYEIWRKDLAAEQGDSVARVSDEAGRIGYLARSGGLALWVRGRGGARQELGAARDPEMEAVLARWSAARGAYEIERSTSPQRSNGETLLRAAQSGAKVLSISETGRDGAQAQCEWRVLHEEVIPGDRPSKGDGPAARAT